MANKAQLADHPQTINWRPISTAPTAELEPIILWNGVDITVGAPWENGFADWLHDWIDPQPTHWHPLPPAPRKGQPS